MGSTKFPLVPPPQGGTPMLQHPGQPGPMMPGEFVGGSIANVTKFAFDNVTPPSTLYVQRDDLLVVSAVSRLVNEIVLINFRFLRVPEVQGGQPSDAHPGVPTGTIFDRGIIEPRSESIALPVAGTAVTTTFSFAEGYILGFALNSVLSNFRGQTFVHAFLARSPGGLFQLSTPLVNDYATIGTAIGWPNGRSLNCVEGPGWIHSINVANPGAGVDWIFTAAAKQRVRVISVSAELAASAAVANRIPELVVDDGVQVVYVGSPNQVVVASATVDVTGSTTVTPAASLITDVMVAIPEALILQPGWRLRSETLNIQAADQWSAIWLNVEEWLESV